MTKNTNNEKTFIKFIEKVIKSGKQNDQAFELTLKGVENNLRRNYGNCRISRINDGDKFSEILETNYDSNILFFNSLGGNNSEFLKSRLFYFILFAGGYKLLKNWSTEFFMDFHGKNKWFGFVSELVIEEIGDDKVKVKHGEDIYYIKKEYIVSNGYSVGDSLKNKFVLTDSSTKKEEMVLLKDFEEFKPDKEGEETIGSFVINKVFEEYEFLDSTGSIIKEIKSDSGDKRILFGGTDYEKYEIEKNNSSLISGINNSLKEINKELILMKLILTGDIKITEELIEKIKKIGEFFSKFFHTYGKEIEEGMLHFDQEMIEESSNTCETLLIMTEEVKKSDLDTGKDSYYYQLFKNSNESLLENVKRMMVLSKLYLNEEENRENEIKRLIPTGIEYTMNPGFKKILGTLLDSHKYRRNTILIGHAGFGKTFGCKITAQLLGQPYYKFACNAQTQIEEFFGSISQNEKGIIVREKGPLTKMMEMGGLFVFDEFNSMSQEAIKALNGILDTIQGFNGEEKINIQISGKDFQIKVHKNFRVCLTGNPVEFIDDYGMLSRVTNDLSRRSTILNTCNDFSGEEFIKETVEEYFNGLTINNLMKGVSEKDFKSSIIERTIGIIKKLSIAVGKGHIELNENNRFFVLNKKDNTIGTLKDSEAMKNAVIPISTIILLPIKNIIDSFEEIKNSEEVMKIFIMKNLSLLLNLTNKVQFQLFESIRLNK